MKRQLGTKPEAIATRQKSHRMEPGGIGAASNRSCITSNEAAGILHRQMAEKQNQRVKRVEEVSLRTLYESLVISLRINDLLVTLLEIVVLSGTVIQFSFCFPISISILYMGCSWFLICFSHQLCIHFENN